MKDPKSMLITLRKHPMIFLNDERLDGSSLVFEGTLLSPPKFPLWPTCADLLVNSRKREFVGLCYYVNVDAECLAEDLSKSLDSVIAKYVNSPTNDDAVPYLNCNLKPNHFQIKWSLTEADKIEIAQLDSDYWYYDENDKSYPLIAVGLNYLDEILNDYELKFPDVTHLKSFNPVFMQN